MRESKLEFQPKKKVVNKLVLVGNGFDLSLGLKTRYEDFLLWYFKSFIIKSLKKRGDLRNKKGDLLFSFNDDELFTFYNKRNYSFEDKNILSFAHDMDSYQKIKDYILSGPHKFNYEFKSKLLEKNFKDSIDSWVDIENAYFELLKDCLKGKTDIEILNKELNQLEKLLHQYLNQLDYTKSLDFELSKKYINQLTSNIRETDIIDKLRKGQNIKTDVIFFLNFNYTKTVDNVINASKIKNLRSSKNIIVNHIHNSLEEESLVFGYGDEMNEEYKKIEELNDNEFFKGIKSFKYAENGRYRDLLRFLNSEDYQVVIYGHSCGLSDRVMLNEIFEHENCKSIKIHYYNKNEFVNKTMDISRHFTNNQMMRKKIVEFNEDDIMPQSV
ncbi:AbiH family protein [Olleya sp. ITB9]|uniref:AbiH family protein n=1 Tax=Olleya sp. ITB9 TaxID=1715648 RepID=UPI0006D08A3D|nr:AbiH family protein [Olleya sp. ITB9]